MLKCSIAAVRFLLVDGIRFKRKIARYIACLRKPFNMQELLKYPLNLSYCTNYSYIRNILTMNVHETEAIDRY